MHFSNSIPHFSLTNIHSKFKMDARVQDVTEGNCMHGLPFKGRWLSFIFAAVNVLRMIKLFGWERKVSDRIGGKRNTELRWLWKLKVGKKTFLLLSTCH